MKKSELKQKILDTKLKSEDLFIPEWDTKVTIKELNGSAFLDISEQAIVNGELNKKKFLELAIIDSTFTEDSEPLFDKEDLELVSNLPVSIYSALVTVVTRINGINNPKN